MTQPHHPDPQRASGTGPARTVGAGRYELGRALGRGGMAEVSMAHDVRLGRTVAVKTLRPDLAQDPVARSRFGREAQNAASLNHPAIVSVYDTGEDRVGGDLVPFIVMECVEGRTVRELLAEGNPIPREQALRITEGVLEALEYSHRHGIIHRDIKPANVIITHSGAVKVMDFGIARAMHSAATTMTQTGMVMGTPQYLSPEQALGRTVDARSDLYSSGCLLYELLTLRPPFNGDTPLSVVYQHVQDDPRPPSELDTHVPRHLDAIALKALAKDPDDRYQSADEMRMDIRRALAGQPVTVAMPRRAPGAYGETVMAPTARLNAADPGTRTTALPRPAGPGDRGPRTGALPPVDDRGKRRGAAYVAIGIGVVLVLVGAVFLALALTKGSGNSGNATQNPPSGTGSVTGAPSEPGYVPPAQPGYTPSASLPSPHLTTRSTETTHPSATSSVTDTPTTNPTHDTQAPSSPPTSSPPTSPKPSTTPSSTEKPSGG